jgi:hypothetical protein
VRADRGPRTSVVLAGFAGALAVVFAAAFGLGRAVPEVGPAPAEPAATTPAPAPADHPATGDMTDMTGTAPHFG